MRKPSARVPDEKGSTKPVAGGVRNLSGRSGDERFEVVMKAAERSGLLSRKNDRIAGRISSALVKQAKKSPAWDAKMHGMLNDHHYLVLQ